MPRCARRVGLGLALVLIPAALLAAPAHAPAAAAPAVAELPIVPRIDAEMKARLQAVVARGRLLGNRADGVRQGRRLHHRRQRVPGGPRLRRPAGAGASTGTCASTVDFYRRTEVGGSSVAVRARRPASGATAWPRCPAGRSTTRCAFPGRAPHAPCTAASRGWSASTASCGPPWRSSCTAPTTSGDRRRPVALPRAAARAGADVSVDWGVIPILSTIPPRLDRRAWAAAWPPTTPRSRGWPARSRCRCSTTGARCRGRG